ncbi:MAG TPA: hypothetical protein VF920_13935 [Dongiaceae bacterium]
MEKHAFEAMLTDVATHFATPRDILVNKELSRPQKLKLLQQWDYDMQLLLAASDENMPNTDDSKSGAVAERIAELRRVLSELGAAHDPEAAGPSKVAAPVVDAPQAGTKH